MYIKNNETKINTRAPFIKRNKDGPRINQGGEKIHDWTRKFNHGQPERPTNSYVASTLFPFQKYSMDQFLTSIGRVGSILVLFLCMVCGCSNFSIVFYSVPPYKLRLFITNHGVKMLRKDFYGPSSTQLIPLYRQ